MSLDPNQLRLHVIRPALAHIGLHGEAAEELALGTAIQESGLRYLRQLGAGPALGLCQMEPATHNDIWTNFLAYKKELAAKILAPHAHPDPERLIWDLRYAFAMCRVHYLRVPHPLPPAGDLPAQAAYWKQWYNTPLGAGTPEQYISSWRRVMGRL